jgi:hypothetical protein
LTKFRTRRNLGDQLAQSLQYVRWGCRDIDYPKVIQ